MADWDAWRCWIYGTSIFNNPKSCPNYLVITPRLCVIDTLTILKPFFTEEGEIREWINRAITRLNWTHVNDTWWRETIDGGQSYCLRCSSPVFSRFNSFAISKNPSWIYDFFMQYCLKISSFLPVVSWANLILFRSSSYWSIRWLKILYYFRDSLMGLTEDKWRREILGLQAMKGWRVVFAGSEPEINM